MSSHDPDILDTEDIYHCWLVWKLASDGGRPYLVSVDTTESLAKRHEQMVKEEAKVLHGLNARQLRSLVQIERSFLNHVYGETMGQGYDRVKVLAQEVRRATVDDLEKSRKRVDELEKGIRSILHGNEDDGMEEPAARLDASLDMLRNLLQDGGGA
jgi:hypothetical protein